MTMFCDCGNPEAHRGEHIPKPMTDTPLDLDAILAAHASASPYGRTEVAGRFHASYYADDADVALVFASIPALVAALRKAEAAHAALVADLRALRPVQHVCSDGVWLRYADVRDLADRHAPTTGATP